VRAWKQASIADCQAGCDRGELAACNELGARYARGDGVTTDNVKAVALYTLACDGENALGCMNLGAMYWEGDGVPRNDRIAALDFRKGCEGGVAAACLNLSIAYGTGRGVPKDPAESVRNAVRGCTGGAPVGCVRASMAKIAGDGVPKDVQGGLGELDALCSRKEAAACKQLASIYVAGIAPDVPADPVRVRDYGEKACRLGSKESCQLVGQLAKGDTLEARAGQSNEIAETRCNAGDLMMCTLLGENLLAGRGAGVDRARGIALLERACRGRVERACRELGDGGGR